jgi:chemotaxis protein histidine kinase CheA
VCAQRLSIKAIGLGHLPQKERREKQMRKKTESKVSEGDKETRAMGIRVQAVLLDRLHALSRETGISQNQLVVNFLELGLDLADSPVGKAAFELRAWVGALREPLYECSVLERRVA